MYPSKKVREQIKRILGRQYSSKVGRKRDRDELKKEIEELIKSNFLTNDYVVKVNELTGYIYITKRD